VKEILGFLPFMMPLLLSPCVFNLCLQVVGV